MSRWNENCLLITTAGKLALIVWPITKKTLIKDLYPDQKDGIKEQKLRTSYHS